MILMMQKFFATLESSFTEMLMLKLVFAVEVNYSKFGLEFLHT